MAFRFKELRIWQKAFQLSNEIDTISKSFPKAEMFSLGPQIKRAANSVVLNIAEGSTGQTKPEFKRFLGMSLRSAIEVVPVYLWQKQDFTSMRLSLKNIMKNMNSFVK